MAAASGCRTSTPALVRYTRGYVRLGSLASLHPSWQDVLRLDALIAQARSLPSAPAFASAPLPEIPEPPALRPESAGADLASEERNRISQVARPAIRRIDSLRNTLNLRDRRRLADRSKTIRAQADADILDHLNSTTKQEQAEKQAIMREYHVPIRDAWLKQFVHETQVSALPPGLAAVRARQSLIEARKQHESLEEESKAKQEAASARAEQLHAAYVRDRNARAEADLAAYRLRLANQTAAEIRQSQNVVNLVLRRLEPLEPPTIPEALPLPAAQMESPTQVAAAARKAPQPQIQSAAARSLSELARQRSRLVRYIESDLRRRIDAAAAEHKWTVVYSPAPGTPDMTGAVADVLRGSWKP